MSLIGRVARILLSLIVAPTFLAMTFASPAGAEASRGLDGVWEGALAIVQVGVPTAAKHKTWTLRVEIDGESARVWYKPDIDWVEVEQPFRVQRLRSNAVITSIESGRDEEGVWVETWSVALAQKSDGAALAVYSRLVNNENLPLTSDHKAFSVAATGDLSRTSR
ncbi:MAG: hypothetical protein K8S25_15040 [Alphaproteobacteria bacterium]|nr:hypothetical protein [Alphaproteobacteria bacterium]